MQYQSSLQRRYSPYHRQRGMALVLALVILVVMTVLGLTALRTSSSERLQVQSAIDVNQAFSVAEIGLREAENWLLTLEENPLDCECGDFAVLALSNTMYNESETYLAIDDWSMEGNEGTIILNRETIDGEIVEVGPAFFIIRETFVGETDEGDEQIIYEITAVGYGAKLGTKMVLQSTFVRVYDGDSGNGQRFTWRALYE